MSILVVNCFHWIGFHVVDGLLEKGEEVDGIDLSPPDEMEHLSLFFGRNSLFQQVDLTNRKEYETAIIIGDYDGLDQVNSKRYIIINGKKGIEKGNRSFITNIHVRLLFGEWMPMDQRGVYVNGQHITFDSNLFLTQAVYITDFVQGLLNWMTIPSLPRSLNIKSRQDKRDTNEKLENTIFLKDNTPIEEKIQIVKTHYKRFKDVYPNC